MLFIYLPVDDSDAFCPASDTDWRTGRCELADGAPVPDGWPCAVE